MSKIPIVCSLIAKNIKYVLKICVLNQNGCLILRSLSLSVSVIKQPCLLSNFCQTECACVLPTRGND